MILIGGTNLQIEDLPMHDIMEYQIEEGKALEIKLKTIARRPECFAIYLNESQRSEITVLDDIMDKLVYYKDDDDLISHLMGDNEGEETFETEDFEVEIPDFGSPIRDEEDELSDFESEDIFEEKEETDIFEESSDTDIFKESNDTDIFEDSVGSDIFGVEEESSYEEITEEEEIEETNQDLEQEETGEVEVTTEELEGTTESEKVVQDKEQEEVPYHENLEEVDTELPEFFLQIPNLGDDTDSLKLLLETKDRIIKQKEGMIRELEQERDESYKLQEIQIREIQDIYNKKMEEVNKAISDLEKKVGIPDIEEDALEFLKFHNYSKNYRAVLREGFTESEKTKLGRLNSNYHIIASGSGDSLYTMLRHLKSYIDKNNNVIIVDFSNDPFLPTAYAKHLKVINGLRVNSMDITRDETDLIDMFTSLNKTRVLFTNIYNDIGLLDIDWVKVLRKIDDYASGKPVILLFNNINSFSVRYTASKLSTIGKLYVFAKCSPLILTTLYGDLQLIPSERVNIVAVDYIEVVKSVMTALSAKYQVIPFTKEVDWNKLIK